MTLTGVDEALYLLNDLDLWIAGLLCISGFLDFWISIYGCTSIRPTGVNIFVLLSVLVGLASHIGAPWTPNLK